MLDYGFCVPKGLVDINKKGAHGDALTNKSRYCPCYIDGEKLKLTSPTRVLEPWIHFVVILKICQFIYLL